MRLKRGDTLIEVALAIGIFSMIAITIVSVVSASTSGAQSALEVTLTREELDAQAEALRFIHDSYVNGSQSKNVTENKYAKLWEKLQELASMAEDRVDLTYNPVTCDKLYSTSSGGLGIFSDEVTRGRPTPFIINTRRLGNPADVTDIILEERPVNHPGIFFEPKTYPRIFYYDTGVGADFEQSLYDQLENSSNKISRVEGLYIIGVQGSANIANGVNVANTANAYYDFYIRSCWMPPGTDRASTISTVVRLYNPAVIE